MSGDDRAHTHLAGRCHVACYRGGVLFGHGMAVDSLQYLAVEIGAVHAIDRLRAFHWDELRPDIEAGRDIPALWLIGDVLAEHVGDPLYRSLPWPKVERAFRRTWTQLNPDRPFDGNVAIRMRLLWEQFAARPA